MTTKSKKLDRIWITGTITPESSPSYGFKKTNDIDLAKKRLKTALSIIVITSSIIIGFPYLKKTELYKDFYNYYKRGIISQTENSIQLSPDTTEFNKKCIYELKKVDLDTEIEILVNTISKESKIKRKNIEDILKGIRGNDFNLNSESELKIPIGYCK